MRKHLSERRLLWSTIALSVAVRLGAAFALGDRVEELPGITDQLSYHELSQRVLGGHGFSFGTGWWPATPANQPTAHWSYLYVSYLAAVYGLFGVHALTARIIQAVLVGILHPLLIYRIGNRVFGRPVGILSAGISSAYAYFVYYSAALVTEAMYFVAMLWLVDIATTLLASKDVRDWMKWRHWIRLGLAFAVGGLLRQLLLVLMPLVLLWIVWRLVQQSGVQHLFPVLKRATVVVAVVLAFILPWTARNYKVFGQAVLLNTNAGFAFFWGNHPIHGRDFIPILPGDGSRYGALIPEELRGLNEGALDRALLRRGFGFVQADPIRYALLSVSRTKEYFKFWWDARSGNWSNYSRILSFGLCLPLLLLGLTQAGKKGNGAWFLLLLAGGYTLIHLLTWTLVRYRLPVDAITVPFMALGLISAYRAALNGLDRVANLRRPLSKTQSV